MSKTQNKKPKQFRIIRIRYQTNKRWTFIIDRQHPTFLITDVINNEEYIQQFRLTCGEHKLSNSDLWTAIGKYFYSKQQGNYRREH